MKKLIFLSIALLSIAFIPAIEKEKLVGTWEHKATSEEDDTFILTFQSNGLFFLEEGGSRLGGAKFFIEELDIWARMNYETDYSKSPFYVDIIMTDLATNKEFQRMPCIFQFLKNGDLQIAFGDEGPRPTNYEEDNAFVMKRIK